MCLLLRPERRRLDELVQSEDEHQLSQNDGGALELDRLPAIISKVANLEHAPVKILRRLREQPFEVRKEWRVVQCPLGGLLVVPFP